MSTRVGPPQLRFWAWAEQSTPELSDRAAILRGRTRPKDDDQTSGLSEGRAGGHKAVRRIWFNRHLWDAAAVDTTDGGASQPTPPPQRFCSNYVSTAKYSFISFFPCFLYEQFQRYSNCFFLFIGLLQQIPDVSPTGRYTTIVPLFFILMISAIKEVIEDYKRHKADNETNRRKVEVLRSGAWDSVMWRNVEVGDVVKVHNDSFFPADMVLLSSSEPQGMCYIETANLDGETNLKIRQGLSQTSSLLDTAQLQSFAASLDCEPPHFNLYDFSGNVTVMGRGSLPLGPEQLLLRGAKLRNTNWIFGLVVYTGVDTKLMQNSNKAPLKRSSLDRATNSQVLILFGLLVGLCIVSAIFNAIWNSVNAETHTYIPMKDSTNFFYNLLTFIILFNNLIPISLQVSLEVVRYFQATFINEDKEMFHVESGTPAAARTSNLNEELGQVKFIFTDKTGTLTCNVMVFKKCSVAGEVFGFPEAHEQPHESHLIRTMLAADKPTGQRIREFLTLLAVCHTVIPERDKENGTILYHAASPDERALVEGARQFGFVFETRVPEFVTISVLGCEERYEILNVIEFTSTRKRMSVVVRTPTGQIKLFCKGADSVIFERLNDRTNCDLTLHHLEGFATEGLRTLCCAVADISEEHYEEWKHTYHKAATALQDRATRIEEAAELIEIGLRLVGATAIEDKLQDGVPEAIAQFLKADIHVWILTGDKQETAINIGYSCRLLTQGMQILILDQGSLDSTRDKINEYIRSISALGGGGCSARDSDFALIVDGKTLTYALSYDLCREFLALCTSCRSVVCCRVSPLQKAEVVGMVTAHTKFITLAIGDGANDVAMIQKANVGIGISGQEGLQAACASDYSIAQFRYLARLLFVHGAWNYARMSKLILYSFYKNICLYVIELWYAIYSGWSGQILFERWTIGFYNVLFTAAPPLAMGLFDRACSADAMMSFPLLYKSSQLGSAFNRRVFWIWIANSLFHSVLLYWLPLMAFQQDVVWSNGREGGYLVLGNTVYSYVVMTVCLKAALVTHYWTWVTHLAIWGSIIAWFIFLVIYSNFWPTIPLGAVMAGQDHMVFTSPVFWLGLVLIPFTALLPDATMKIGWLWTNKNLEENVRESEVRNRDPSRIMQKERSRLTETARLLKNVKNVFRRAPNSSNIEVELSHGYAFSQEEHGAVTQSEVIRAYNTNLPKPEGM
ncbi:probable phospholipid-transporting ATPase IA isoform X2 [Neocloeon triangulifer]|uniref:probable phospholipid-transporting ATPase IA isoform X2 n=1 Tax=Neocloeon triangulifer TaxID=2078957 RepID=UPI00286F5525|nr:probable phospholipid-transporting ATPase IA isoform X2 [Neocloeon triangulifer]